ncbi:hypothetical protein Tco_0906573 [Tanacetum coccineum]|uniref:Uncharacterized protein n=1 Tax=Tanacetum coccineum TaxID=301880 RepID=A0ABQ5CJ66_9ASTR
MHQLDHPLSGTLEQLDRILVGKIQIVDVGKLWEHIPIVGWMIVENKVLCGELGLVLQTVKTDMVKHDVEFESLGKCVDEIDKLTEVMHEDDN